MFKLKIETDNEVFEYLPQAEIVSLLKSVCEKLYTGKTYGKLMDRNGNTVGDWEFNNE